MSSNPEIIDILSLTRLTWDLYHSCHLVAGGAPDGFRQLVNELASLQGILRALCDHANSNSSFFEELAEDRKPALQRCLNGCFNTLQQLQGLVTRYRELGVGDGYQVWHKVKWATPRGQIEELKSRIMIHTANLHLYMSSIGNSSLNRLENLMHEALEKDTLPEPHDIIEPSTKMPSPLTMKPTIYENPVGSNGTSDSETSGSAKLDPAGHRAIMSGTYPRHSSSSSGSRASAYSDGSASTLFTNSPFPTSPKRGSTLNSPTSLRTNLVDRTQSPRSSGSIQEEYFPGPRNQPQFEYDGSGTSEESGNTHVKHAVASAMRQLHEIQKREQHLRPLRYEPRNRFHQLDPTVAEKFESSSNEEERVRRSSTRDWLRVAVWWLLKARTTLANCDKPNLVSARGSMSPSTISSTSSHQAYVDLLKASYILYEVVLRRQPPQSLMMDENRKLISDLSEGINEDFSQFSSVDIPDSAAITMQNLDIWEPLQPDEASTVSNESLLDLENVRYTTVELEDAGAEEERVLLRSFVNAGIGGKKLRMRTKGAPYMLLLSTLDGECEPKVTVCNQSGTLCLQRNFTHEDLAQLIRVSNASLSGTPGAKISEPVTLKFDSMPISVSFQYATDLGQFINIPKSYFDAVWQREPVDSEQFSEGVIFKSSVGLVEQLRAPIMKSLNPPMITRSCEVRILERTFGEVWRSIRRMVISSSLAEKAPKSLEFFMPMSRVQVSRSEDSRLVQLKWSDTGQEKSDKTDGSYNPLFSYVYDDNSPNIGLNVEFRTEQQAERFEKVILSFTHKPTFSWLQPSSSGQVYDMADVALDQKQYKAVFLLENRLSYKYSSIFYLYRDTDYIYDSSGFHVKFPKIFYVDYISSHVEQLYRAADTVFFSHCEKKIRPMEIHFNDEPILHAFMSSLASTYELCFSRRAESMTTKKQSFLGSSKSSKGETEVQLWRKGNSIQLASRWTTNHVTDKWLTMPIPSGSSRNISRDTNRIEFPTTTYSRGTVLNLAVIVSGSARDPRMMRRSGPITISFPKPKDRDDFIAALDGDRHPSWKYGHGYDPRQSLSN
ncbi:hypothetical protein BDW59DRAFT_164451 [Aspergillus cavernicola]|uniref:Fungal N-terminal domain-containing protein n=1 Tax=Aspergillus cavernicola TaxID=176166 RepID=A0ABR4HZH2_9EURO